MLSVLRTLTRFVISRAVFLAFGSLLAKVANLKTARGSSSNHRKYIKEVLIMGSTKLDLQALLATVGKALISRRQRRILAKAAKILNKTQVHEAFFIAELTSDQKAEFLDLLSGGDQ